MDAAMACMKYIIFTLNFLLWCLGGALMGLGVWIRSDSDFWEYHQSLKIAQYYQACYVAIAVGAIILIIGFFGCCGAALDSPCMLLVYCIIMTCVLILELAAAGLVWKASNGDKFQKVLTDEIQESIERSKYSLPDRRFIDLLQLHMECCGGYDKNDYQTDQIPQSCSSDRTNNVYIHGCGENIRRYLERKGGMIGGVALGVALIQVMSLIFSCCLFCTLRQEAKSYI